MSEPASPPLANSLRGLVGTVLTLARLRLDLLSVEAQEEMARVGGLLLYGALAVIGLSLGVGFLAILITVLLWDSHRLLALAVFATLFGTLGTVAALAASRRARQGTRLFAASLDELRQDRERLGP